MARFPTANDLGWTQAAPTRPVGSFDATAVARGAEKIAQATTQFGAGIGKLAEGAGELGQDESRWQYSKAQSDFVSRKIDLDSAIGQDQNYGPDANGKNLVDRYTDQLNGIRAQSANLIQDPRMREAFINRTQPYFNEGVVQAQSHARALSNDAQIGYVADMGNKAINQAVAATNDDARAKVIDSYNELIDGLADSGAISSAAAIRMKQDWAHQYATADVLSRTYATPANVTWLEVFVQGGGGGGAGSGTSPGAATAGGDSTFGTSFLTANGGAAGTTNGATAAGGVASGGDDNIQGGTGQAAAISPSTNQPGGAGGATPRGGFGWGGTPGGGPGNAALTNTGAGGGGAGLASTANGGGGGGGGGCLRKIITAPNATYAYAVGAAGGGGTAGTGGAAGASGAAGIIIIIEHYD